MMYALINGSVIASIVIFGLLYLTFESLDYYRVVKQGGWEDIQQIFDSTVIIPDIFSFTLMLSALLHIVFKSAGSEFFHPDWKVLTLHVISLAVFVTSRSLLLYVKVSISGFNLNQCLNDNESFQLCWEN